MALGRCSNEGCKSPIEVSDVYREVDIESSPLFVALVYKCPICEDKNKFVASHEDWKKAQSKFAAARHQRENDFRAHQIELDAVNTVEELEALWSSLRNPPLREDSKGACKCASCEEKWYGKRF